MSFFKETKTKKKKKKKLNKRILLIGVADGLWSQVVKYKSNFFCEKCGSTNNLNAHHIFSRQNIATRFDLSNGLCLCANCHIYDTDSAHHNPEEFLKFTSKRKSFKKLEKKSKKITKLTIGDLQEIILNLQIEKEKYLKFNLK